MKKENILVAVLLVMALLGTGFYLHDKLGKTHNNVAGGSSLDGNTLHTSGVQLSGGQTPDERQIVWKEYADGLDLSREQGKPVFLYFYTDWCTYCRKLKKTSFKDPTIISYLNENFINIAIDKDVQEIIANSYKVKGVPTLWFLEPGGKMIKYVPGYVEKDRLLLILKYIHSQSYQELSFHEFVRKMH